MIDDLVHRWRTFWFRPESTAVLGLVRIAFGAVMVAWTLSLLPDLSRLVGDGSVMPSSPTVGFEWGLFDLSDGAGMRTAVGVGLLLASIALTVGWHSRVAALLVLVGLMTLQRGNPYAFNSGDALLRLEAIYLALAPCGSALSLDRRRKAGSFWSASHRAPWALRLMQLQLSLIYLSSFLNKLSGPTWRHGTAVSYALQMTDIGNVSPPSAITGNTALMAVATWGVLALELAIGVLVWSPRARPKVLIAGVVLHTAIVLTFGIAFFSFAMLVLYLAFLPPDRVAAWVAPRAATDRKERSRLARRHRFRQPTPIPDVSRSDRGTTSIRLTEGDQMSVLQMVGARLAAAVVCLCLAAGVVVSAPMTERSDERSAAVTGQISMSAHELAALREATATPEQQEQLVSDMQDAFRGVAQVGVGDVPSEDAEASAHSSSVGDLQPVVAYGVTRNHFWITASYADMVRGAITAAVQACKVRVPAALCTAAGALLKRLASGWGSSSRHGVWAEIYWAPPHYRGGRW